MPDVKSLTDFKQNSTEGFKDICPGKSGWARIVQSANIDICA